MVWNEKVPRGENKAFFSFYILYYIFVLFNMYKNDGGSMNKFEFVLYYAYINFGRIYVNRKTF